jgi:Chaperone for flagella basal body P-ring formation
MKRIVIAILSSIVLSAAGPLCAAACNTAQLSGTEGPGADNQIPERSLPERSIAEHSIVDHYITDAILHRKWAVVVDCGHPDRPWTVKAVPWSSDTGMATLSRVNASQPAVIEKPLVSAGAKVRLWRTAGSTDIELVGTALEAGGAGQTIHVRTGLQGAVLEGRVRGAGSVELFHSNRWATQ